MKLYQLNTYMTTMELDDIFNFDRLYCTGEQARAGWYLDQDAILEAIDKLGIKLHVQIKFMTAKRRGGTHRVTRKRTHHITVDQTTLADFASSTLWHELAHAMQAERWANETGKDIYYQYWEDYKQVDGEWGNRYKGNTYEIEADRIAAENADFHLVIFGT